MIKRLKQEIADNTWALKDAKTAEDLKTGNSRFVDPADEKTCFQIVKSIQDTISLTTNNGAADVDSLRRLTAGGYLKTFTPDGKVKGPAGTGDQKGRGVPRGSLESPLFRIPGELLLCLPMSDRPPSTLSPEDLAHCTRMLESIAADSLILSQLSNEDRIRLLVAAGRAVHPDKTQVRRRIGAMRTLRRRDMETRDRTVRAATTIRAARRDSFFIPPPARSGQRRTRSRAPTRKPRFALHLQSRVQRRYIFSTTLIAPECAPFQLREIAFQSACWRAVSP